MSVAKKIIKLGLILSMGLTQVWANEYFPKGCQPMAIDTKQMDMKLKRNQLLFVHNLSDKQIWLADRHLPKLTRGLSAGTWSVLYAPKLPLSWRCIQSEQGHEQHVACQAVIGICQWSALAPKNMKSVKMMWLLENQNLVYAKAYLQRMGWLFDQKRSKLEKTES